jgi:hypothetical protein
LARERLADAARFAAPDLLERLLVHVADDRVR